MRKQFSIKSALHTEPLSSHEHAIFLFAHFILALLAATFAMTTNGTGKPALQAGPTPAYTITIDDILARRKRGGRLVAGTAAVADIDSFKSYAHWRELPHARRWDHLLSKESAARGPCVLKQAARYLKNPDIISLGGGLPSAEIFPLLSLSLRVPTGKGLVPGDFSEATAVVDDTVSGGGGTTTTVGKYDMTTADAEFDLATALNYGQAAGSPQLLRWVTEHAELVCHPPYADWRVCLTVGSTGALEQSLRIFCDRERGDTLLTEEYSFSTALETAAPMGLRVRGVAMDDEGLRPDSLEELLANWDTNTGPQPHLLYTVPSGQNPTGTTQSPARRKAVYEICQRYDVYILEDEPYYFLQMPPYARPGKEAADKTPAASAEASGLSSGQAFLQSLLPTYVSMDVDGRVLRMDSFSKVLVPGSRTGWITASEQIIERFMRHAEVCSQGPSGFAQVSLYQVLDQTWGHAGYLSWLKHLRDMYTRRRDILVAACEDHLPKDVVSWNTPRVGMFHWLRVDHTRHPDHGTRSLLDLEEEIFNTCIEKGVLVARGSWFAAEPDAPPAGMFFRATFAAASADSMTEAIRRFGEAVRESFKLDKAAL